ncbi:MAG: 6-phosphogluconolactonase, partial [Gammaproteobacteria bacterium]|nr:6-phosphogluconolactonase [Gammaproteobacteria bacterium]
FVYRDFQQASQEAADFIADKIQSSITENGVCHVVLPGGQSPSQCLAYLADKKLAWHKVHWYPGDERCYPSAHADRNDVMLQNNLWSRIGKTLIHQIPAELGAEKAASLFSELISNVDHFDIAFLGMGEDGHTASLFPDNAALHDARTVVPVHHAPKAPPDRVSLGINTLRQAKCRLVLAAGDGKKDIIARIKNAESLPVNSLGDINWFVDEAAFN